MLINDFKSSRVWGLLTKPQQQKLMEDFVRALTKSPPLQERMTVSESKSGDVIHHEGPIALPNGMTAGEAAEILHQIARQQDATQRIRETIHVSPWEGALALGKALTEKFGFNMSPESGSNISIEVGPNGETALVPWGCFEFPGTDGGTIETDTSMEGGRRVFTLLFRIRGKYRDKVQALVGRIKELAISDSPYRGKALVLELTDEDDDLIAMPKPKFFKLQDAPMQLVLRRTIERDLDINIYALIREAQMARDAGIPLRRGVLLCGPFGVGKTLTAYRIAQECMASGWTFLYLPKAKDLIHALSFSYQYQPCVLLCEDVDRIMGENRNNGVNSILNAIDGVDNKSSETMVVYTTNHPELINSAMQRPGRLDAVINFLPPDAEAVVRLVQLYAVDILAKDQALDIVGKILEGQNSAIVREAVERAKLAALLGGRKQITTEDLAEAAQSVLRQVEVFKASAKVPKDVIKEFGNALGETFAGALANYNGGQEPSV